MRICPFCGSDKVYPLLGTLRCKRCKNIWKEEGGVRPACPGPHDTLRTRKKTAPLETRLAKRLDTCLERHGGKFCPAGVAWPAGEISRELFLHYLDRCVKDRTLAEKKDRAGRTWYSRP
jgi:hypothetical protein